MTDTHGSAAKAHEVLADLDVRVQNGARLSRAERIGLAGVYAVLALAEALTATPTRSSARTRGTRLRRLAMASDLIDLLADEQQQRCAYGTRDGDGRTCDCKFSHPVPQVRTSEMTGCPELRVAIWTLRTNPRPHPTAHGTTEPQPEEGV